MVQNMFDLHFIINFEFEKNEVFSSYIDGTKILHLPCIQNQILWSSLLNQNIIWNTVWLIMLIVYHHFFSFLSAGDSFNTLALCFRLGVSTVQKIIMDTCDAIWESLAPTYLPEPKKKDWKNIAADFYQRWNFPNCMGALAENVVVQAPAKSGSLHF